MKERDDDYKYLITYTNLALKQLFNTIYIAYCFLITHLSKKKFKLTNLLHSCFYLLFLTIWPEIKIRGEQQMWTFHSSQVGTKVGHVIIASYIEHRRQRFPLLLLLPGAHIPASDMEKIWHENFFNHHRTLCMVTLAF